VREWLKSLSAEDRKRIGEDIKTGEFGWPVGMPVCRFMGGGIYEVRSDLPTTALHVCFFIFIRMAGWSCCMVSSRKLRGRQTKTWNWHGETRISMRGPNDSKEEERRDRSHGFDF